jgi:hypothetical protein
MRKATRAMLRSCLTVLICCCAGPALGQVEQQWQVQARHHGWVLDYAEAIRTAEATGKPLMVVLRCVP